MKKQNSKAHDLFLLMFHLSQLRGKDKIVNVFVEALREIWPEIDFEYQASISYQEENGITISTGDNNYGWIQISNNTQLENEDQSVLNNAIAMLAVILKKNEQDILLGKEKIHLQKLVDEKIVAIKESEKKFRNFFENSPIGQSMTEVDGLLKVNKAFCDMLGYSDQESKTIKWQEITYPEDLSKSHKVVESLLNGNNDRKQYEKRYIHKDGSIVWAEVTTTLHRDTENEQKYFITSIQDITQRKLAKEKLRESDAFKEKLLNSSPDIIYIYDLVEKRNVYSNEGIRKILGYTLEDIQQMGEELIPALMHPEDLEAYIQNILPGYEKLKDHELLAHKFRMKHKNGTWYWFQARESIYLRSKIGTPEQIFGIMTDITERVKAENETKEHVAFLDNMMEQSPFAMWISDPSGTIIKTNKILRQLLNLEDDQLIGRYNVYKDNNLKDQGVMDLVSKVFSDSQPARFEIAWTGESTGSDAYAGASSLWIDVSMFPIKDVDGNLRNVVCQWIDITDRKQAERDLLESEMKFRGIYEQSPITIEVFDKEGKLIDVNQKTLEMFGVDDKKYVLGFDLWADPNLSDKKMKLLKSGQAIFLSTEFDFEKVKDHKLYPTSKSGIMYMDMYAIPLIINNLITGYLVQILDVTERRQMLITLKDRNAYIESIIENMPIGFALNTISDGSVQYMNERFEDIYGWPREVVTNISIFFEKVFPEPEYRKKMQAKIIADMESGDPERMDWKDLKIVTSSGEARYVHAINIPLIEQNLMISTVQDTTKRKKAEDELIKHRDNLEKIVTERTNDLELVNKALIQKNDELEKFNQLFVDREFRIKELRDKIKSLENEIE